MIYSKRVSDVSAVHYFLYINMLDLCFHLLYFYTYARFMILRVWSIVGNIYTKTRNRLLRDNVSAVAAQILRERKKEKRVRVAKTSVPSRTAFDELNGERPDPNDLAEEALADNYCGDPRMSELLEATANLEDLLDDNAGDTLENASLTRTITLESLFKKSCIAINDWKQ